MPTLSSGGLRPRSAITGKFVVPDGVETERLWEGRGFSCNSWLAALTFALNHARLYGRKCYVWRDEYPPEYHHPRWRVTVLHRRDYGE
jgi:hypothetical protein